MSIKALNFLAPINPLGYGVVSLNLFLALREQGVDIKLWPIGQVDCHPKHAPLIQEAIDTRHEYQTSAPSIRIWHQHDLAQHVGGGMHIGFPIFELDKFTEIEKAEMKAMDTLCVCSQWAKNVVLDNCPEIPPFAIRVVPCGVDRQTFHERVGVPDENWTTFLNIGKWEYRKGHDAIAEAFAKAFSPKDRVRLWMMNHNPFISEQQTQEWESLYKNTHMRVSFLPRVQSHAEVAKVMSEADCGVFPARAEGWNLELLEMMSMGKQVIATDYSAHTEFCNHDNCHLISIDAIEPAYDGVFFGDDTVGNWASLGDHQVDSMVEHMRAVHKDKRHNPHGVTTGQAFSWEAAAQQIIEIGG
jgi:hypothetical protein